MKIGACLLILFSGTALAETAINIDFGSAGTQGVWNNVTSLTTTPVAGLVDLAGNPTTVTISSSRSLVAVTPISQPFSGNDAKLLGDYLVSSQNDFVLTLNGLQPDVYRIFTYTVGRQDFPRSSTVTPFGNSALTATNTGVWAGLLEEGITHSVHDLEVTAGGITLHFFSAADGFVSGMQITSIPEPSSLSSLLAFLVVGRKRSRCTH